jgi:UDP-N-acetyl-D-glucosamine dehydrogenase
LTPWPAREFHRSTEFIELAGKINQRMPYHCAERVEQAVNDIAKPIKGSKILILGASYKGGVGDIRESPALRIIEVPQSRGGIVSYHDDCVPSLSKFGLETVPLDELSPKPTRSCWSPPTPRWTRPQWRPAAR